MTTTTTTDHEVTVQTATYLRAIKSEWVKARSIRSTWILLGVALVLSLLIAFLVLDGVDPANYPELSASAQGANALFSGSTFVLLILAIFGSMVITSEFSSGMSRNTFTATPSRGAVLGAKATVVALYALVVGLLGFGMAYVLFGSYLTELGTSVNLGDADTLRIFLINELTFVVVALLSLGLGTIMRSSVGTIFTVVGLLLVLPGILLIVSNKVANWVGAVLPTNAASSAMSGDEFSADSVTLGATAGLIVLVLWAVVPLGGALAALRARDI